MILPTRHLRPWLWAGLALSLSTSCAVAGERFDSPAAAAQYHVMVGELAALRQQPQLAAQEFMKALDLVPDADLAHRAAGLAVVAKDEPLALKAAKKWQQLEPTSPEARQVVALLSLRAGKRNDVIEQCEGIIKSDPGGPEEGFRDVALLLSKDSGKKDDALAIMDTLVKKHPTLAGAFYAQALLSLRYNQLDAAERSARESLRLKSSSRESQLLLTGVLVKKGDVAGADAAMAELLKGGDKTGELRLSYAKLLVEANQPDAARRQFEAVLAEHPDNGDARLAVGLLALEKEDYDGAEKQFKALLNSPLLKPQAAYYLGRIEETRNHYKEALDWFKQVDQGDSAIDAGIRRAIVLGKLGKVDEGRTLLAAMREQLPMFADRFFAAEGEMLLDANKPEAALAMYQDALNESPDDTELLYGRSLVHERMNHVPLAEADLRRILEAGKEDHDPEKEARALNALGYMLTVHTERLGEARKLIAKAMELTPDDPAVIDSMGWVEYKMGNVKDARAMLEKAFDKLKDPEIAAHLGEVLWSQGEKERAKAVWNQGLGKDPMHRVLRDTVNRLTNK